MKEHTLTLGEMKAIESQIEANDQRMEELLLEMEQLNEQTEELLRKLKPPKKFIFF